MVLDTGIEVVDAEEALSRTGIPADENRRVVHDTAPEDRIETVNPCLNYIWHGLQGATDAP